jgi:hypothetical protein
MNNANLIEAIGILEDAIDELLKDRTETTSPDGSLEIEIHADLLATRFVCHAMNYLENQLNEGDFYL